LSIFYSLTHSEFRGNKVCRGKEWKLALFKLSLAFLAFPLVILELSARSIRKSFVLFDRDKIREDMKMNPN
jgi:hypothetical protein